MFTIEMLPAREGDCIVLTWECEGTPRRILIDGGRKATYDDLSAYVEALPEAERVFELLIVTHIDRDHIEGLLALLDDPDHELSFKDVWFNGYHHLESGEIEEFGAVQGERFTRWLTAKVEAQVGMWNGPFGDGGNKAVMLPEDGKPLAIDIDEEMRLVLLSPNLEKLQELIPEWERQCKDAGIVAGEPAVDPDEEGFEVFGGIDIEELAEEMSKEDGSEPNGASIAVIAEYREHKVLLAGDAHPGLLLESLKKLDDADAPIALDAVKLPHHGSRKNTSKELLQAIQCPKYLFSTNGSYFDHPDPVAVSRVIRYGGPNVELWFNYLSDETQVWDVQSWREDHEYSVHYPEQDSDGFQCVKIL